jgi:hypothetical protein
MTFILEYLDNVLTLPKTTGGVKNLLIQLEQNLIEHFITKSYITAGFETSERRVEYHLYHKFHPEIGKWNDKEMAYPNLRFKPLSKHELAYFRNNLKNYKLEQENQHGEIWVNKSVGFSKKNRKSQQVQLTFW